MSTEWTYLTVWWPTNTADLDPILAQKGAAGWELVTVWRDTLIFKQPRHLDTPEHLQPAPEPE